jgi:methyl-accepting chemotaxis protein
MSRFIAWFASKAVRNSLILIVLALSAIISYYTISLARFAVYNRDNASAAAGTSEIADALLTLSGALSRERRTVELSIESRVLSLNYDQRLERMTGEVDVSRKTFAVVAELLADDRLSHIDKDMKQRFLAEGAELDRLRNEVHLGITRGITLSNADLPRRFVRALTGLISTAREIRNASDYRPPEPLHRIQANQQLHDAIWVIEENLHHERSQFAILMVKNRRFGPAQANSLGILRGRIAAGWDRVRHYMAHSDADPAIVAAIKAARAEMLDEIDGMRDAAYEAGLTGEPYPVSYIDWLNKTEAALQRVAELSKTIANGSGRAAAGAVALGERNIVIDVGLFVIGALASLLSLYIVLFRVTGPIGRMTGAMSRLAAGNIEIDIPWASRRDEIGEMGRALEIFRGNTIEKAELELERQAKDKETRTEKRRGIMELARRFEVEVKGVVDAVSEEAEGMREAANSMTRAAEDGSGQAAAVAAASREASVNVTTVATAAEELSASIAEIGRQAEQSAEISGRAVDHARSTDVTVHQLSDAAARIGEVVGLINDIAGQTNLLALNATIEAARAGEAGKGFAVVAQEVKNLANQTAKATGEISAQITAIQDQTNSAVVDIRGIRDVIGEINDISTTIASAVEQQGISTHEIARNVQQAARGTGEVDAKIEIVSKAASDTGAAAGQVLSATDSLARRAEELSRKLENFLAEISAG